MAGEVVGIEELAAKIRGIAPAMRKKVLRNALAAGARLVRDDAKRNAPVLSGATKAPYRKRGTVRDAIRVRTSKSARRAGDVGVFVNVKPAKGADRGGKNQNDPFYWRFLEFGTKKMGARSFLRPSADKLGAALHIFTAHVTKWINKTNASGKVIP